MRFAHGSQSHGSIWITAFVLLSATFALSGAALSLAQESPIQVDYFSDYFPAAIAIARIEADGHSSSEARQLLQERLLEAHDASTPANRTELVPSAQLQNDQLYVQGSREYINLVQQQLLSIQQFGLKKLLYTMHVVEVPSEEALVVVGKWNLAGAVTSLTEEANSGLPLKKNAVVQASFKASATTFEVRLSDALSDEQINELVGLGKVISSPKIVGRNGTEVNVRVGREVQFIAAYEPVKDENGNDAASMQPKFVNIHDGIKLDLTGAFDDMKENVRLECRFAHSQLKGMDSFTYESKDGPLTVQQPQLSTTGIQTICKAPTNKTIALCSGPIVRETVVEQSVPLIGRIPYVGKLFKKTGKATESISTIILIQCQEY